MASVTPVPDSVAVYYSKGSGPWRQIGTVPRATWWKCLPSSAQTGERVGDLVAAPTGDAFAVVRIWDYTQGLHWPEYWGRNYSPAE